MTAIDAFARWVEWRDKGQALKFPSAEPAIEVLLVDGVPAVLMWGGRRFVLVEYEGDEDG